jgi:hypothetical protein
MGAALDVSVRCLLIDTSMSMVLPLSERLSLKRIDVACGVARSFMSNGWFVISFANEAKVMDLGKPLVPFGDRSEIGKALKLAYSMFASEIVIVTDGYEVYSNWTDSVESVMRSDVPIDVVLVGIECDGALEKLASYTGGRVTRITDKWNTNIKMSS